MPLLGRSDRRLLSVRSDVSKLSDLDALFGRIQRKLATWMSFSRTPALPNSGRWALSPKITTTTSSTST